MSVLDDGYHSHLIKNMAEIVRQTGVPRHYIETSAVDIFTPQVLKPLLGTDNASKSVMLYGDYNESYENMLAYGGVLIRNFLDCRVITLAEAIDMYVKQEFPESRVIMIPDFFVGGDKTPKWVISRLVGMITECISNEQRMVFYSVNRKQMEKEYGDVISGLVDTYFLQVS